MKFFKLCIVFILYSSSAISQQNSHNDYFSTDKKALAIPESMTESTDLIAKYIASNFKTDKDKSRAAFVWVASNISYDLSYSYNTSENRDQKILRSLKNRKGICENYSAIFTEICNKVGIRSYIIEGYTKQNSEVSTQSHAWSASLIDGVWYLFDPTWGAGYIKDGNFVRKLNNSYFLQSPSAFVTSHMPFDYLWQFSNYPINNQDFYEGKIKSTSNAKDFNFQEALIIYESQSYVEKLKSTAKRVQENGLKNLLIKKQYIYLETAVDHLHQNKVIALYNKAAAHYNQALTAYNDFVEIRNKNQNQSKSNQSMKRIVSNAENNLSTAKDILRTLPASNSTTTLAINRLRKSVSNVSSDVQRQKLWLSNYLIDGSRSRKSAFN